jgi:outer membrane receptor for ferrienterochelin and colicin
MTRHALRSYFLLRTTLAALVVSLGMSPALATALGNVRGLVHDPEHRPIQGAQVTLGAVNLQWSKTVITDDEGEFQFDAVEAGEYVVEVAAPGFAPQQQQVLITTGRAASLHFPMRVAAVKQSIEVSAEPATVDTTSSTTQSVIERKQIATTPGADQANSLAMITDFVPSAVVVHDQLHIRGGHQVTWMLDGVPVPNTSIATNVGPQFDPKDIDSIEVQRGGYTAEYGDRTYGVFNVITRSGFERNNEAEIVASSGSFHGTNDQISFGSHTQRFAYYASLAGNRSDLGLETPSTEVLHDLGSGLSTFTSLIFNATPNDQLRLLASLRGDHYQVPNTPEQQAAGIRDTEDERDVFVNFSWIHTAGSGVVLTVSPFYHFNRAHYLGGPLDTPVSPEEDLGSNYVGGVSSLGVVRGKHNARFGVQVFGQRDNAFFAVTTPGDPAASLASRVITWGDVEAAFLEDQYRATSWLTLNGGVRLTRFAGAFTETAADPRVGAAVRVPRLGWVLHGFYGRYYQAPPLLTVSGPILDLAGQQGFGFLPLHGERDEQWEAGLTIPVRGWALESTYFHTAARNYFDHDVLGNSNIFFPVTLARARIRGWETSLRSPQLFRRMQVYLAYSHQYAQGAGGVTGGLTDFEPPASGYYFLDHDQRDTLSTGFHLDLPWRSWTSANVGYGSGFLDGDGPAHLSPHTTVDLALGKSFGERWSLQVAGLNLSNHRYLLDNSNTFGGTHYVNPRRVSIELRYRFHY